MASNGLFTCLPTMSLGREGIVSELIESKDKDFLSLPAEIGLQCEDYEPFLNELTADYRWDKGTWERSGKNENGDLLRYGRALASVHTNHDKNWVRICSAAPATIMATSGKSLEKDPFTMVGQGGLVSLLKGSFANG